ncbi:DUF6000 family protein [Streptomyces griseorubiginosus]|uniref:DUF6000 family protein n=1 Tax=Streptomyces griseorubiginosus TaxID=67304 RepID=UPI0036651C8A
MGGFLYVTPDRRYLRLGGSLIPMSEQERADFTRELGEAAREIGKPAASLIALAGRTVFRERLGELLLASVGRGARKTCGKLSIARSKCSIKEH